MTNFHPQVHSRSTRKTEIKRQLDGHDNKNFHNVEINGQVKRFPVIDLDKDIPIYRINNGRTRSQQISFIKKNNYQKDYFISNAENQEQLNFQHEFLTNLANDPNGNLYQEFKSKKALDKTHDPFLITIDGVVINGNRRLSTVRNLYNENPAVYNNFKTIPCAVIDIEISEIDIEEIENKLQLKRDLKLDYSWINELLKIKYQIDLKLKNIPNSDNINKDIIFTEVGLTMGINDPKKIQEKLHILNFVDLYLEETDQSGDYEVVKNMEQIFKDYTKNINKLSKEADGGAQLSTANKIAIALVKETQDKNLDERAYSYKILLEPDKLLATSELLIQHYGNGKTIDQIYSENKPSRQNLLSQVKNNSGQLTKNDKFIILNKLLPTILTKENLSSQLRQIKDVFDMKKDQKNYMDSVEDALNTLNFIKSEYPSSIDENNKAKIKKVVNLIKEVSEEILKL